MPTRLTPPKTIAALAFAPIAAFSIAASATQYVPLFPALRIQESVLGIDVVDLGRAYDFARTTVTTHCDVAGTAYIRSELPNGSYGPPLTDNFITAGNDKVSVCQGGPGLLPLAGTNCFQRGRTLPMGGSIEETFDATGVSAPIPLNKGSNSTTFKLWDYGGVYGNAKLVLELPQACNTINQWCSPGYWKNHPQAWAALLPNIKPDDEWEGLYKYDPKKRACSNLPNPPSYLDVISSPNCYGGEAANLVADRLSEAHPGISYFGIRVEGSCPLN